MLLMGSSKEGKKLKAIFQPTAPRASRYGIAVGCAAGQDPACGGTPVNTSFTSISVALSGAQALGSARSPWSRDGGGKLEQHQSGRTVCAAPRCPRPCLSQGKTGKKPVSKAESHTRRSVGFPSCAALGAKLRGAALREPEDSSELPTAMGELKREVYSKQGDYYLLSNTDVPSPTPDRIRLGKRLC